MTTECDYFVNDGCIVHSSPADEQYLDLAEVHNWGITKNKELREFMKQKQQPTAEDLVEEVKNEA